MTIRPRSRSSSPPGNAGRRSRTRVTFAATPGGRMLLGPPAQRGADVGRVEEPQERLLGVGAGGDDRGVDLLAARRGRRPRRLLATCGCARRRRPSVARPRGFARRRSTSANASGPPRAKTVRPAAPPPAAESQSNPAPCPPARRPSPCRAPPARRAAREPPRRRPPRSPGPPPPSAAPGPPRGLLAPRSRSAFISLRPMIASAERRRLRVRRRRHLQATRGSWRSPGPSGRTGRTRRRLRARSGRGAPGGPRRVAPEGHGGAVGVSARRRTEGGTVRPKAFELQVLHDACAETTHSCGTPRRAEARGVRPVARIPADRLGALEHQRPLTALAR